MQRTQLHLLPSRPLTGRRRSPFVFDLLMILFTIVFFILALAYIRACERLR